MEADDEAPLIFSKSAETRPHDPGERIDCVPSTSGASPESCVETSQSFKGLGVATWLEKTCKELGMVRPTPVQQHCIPQILMGKDVLGLAETGSGKTAAFALPILQALAENTFGIFALVMTPTRELAYQISDHFKALGSALNLRCSVIVGGLNMTTQAKDVMNRPHVVIATPGRIKDHLVNNLDMAECFSRAKFLVLDEADRLLEVGFEDEMRVVLGTMPRTRQTLLFSATMTGNLRALLDGHPEKTYFYEGYQNNITPLTLKHQYIFLPANAKDIYLLHVLCRLEEFSIRSVIIFADTCRTCHLLSLMMEEMEIDSTALHSMKLQQQRLASLNRFKASLVPILIATDVASRGLDIPTVDLVINYNLPRLTQDYVHRVGRTARAGRGGRAVSLVTQYDVDLLHEIEAVLGKELEEFETDEDTVLKGITKVYRAKRLASLKMVDSGFEDKMRTQKDLKLKRLSENGQLNVKRIHQKKRRK